MGAFVGWDFIVTLHPATPESQKGWRRVWKGTSLQNVLLFLCVRTKGHAR